MCGASWRMVGKIVPDCVDSVRPSLSLSPVACTCTGDSGTKFLPATDVRSGG